MLVYMSRNSKILTTLVINFGAFILFATTNPQHLPLILWITPFVVLFVDVYMLTSGLFFRENGPANNDKRNVTIAHQRINPRALIISLAVTVCLLLESTGQFSIRDLVIIVVLFGILWGYADRISAKHLR